VCGDLPLARERRGDGVLRPREDDEKRVSLSIDFAAAVFLEERAEEVVMLGQEQRIAVAEPLQQPG
jgi:hypothetical protein